MTIKQFIEKAIEGGWDIDRTGREISRILLDPLAWQAVGRAQDKERTDGMKPNSSLWRQRMHQMIDVLAEGKSLIEFVETL